jgi:hypothetical protein
MASAKQHGGTADRTASTSPDTSMSIDVPST